MQVKDKIIFIYCFFAKWRYICAMYTDKKDFYYAVVSKRNGRLILLGGHLPIYWNKKVAEGVCAKFPRSEVKKIHGGQLEELLKEA